MARMPREGNHQRLTLCLLIFSLVVCWGVWRWATAVLVPASTASALAEDRPIGNNSDLYPRWLGTREALLHHKNPYGAEVTRQIQAGYYGRPLDVKRLADPKDQVGFAYPLYVVFLLAPTVFFPFSKVMECARWFLMLGTAASVPLWMRGLGLRFSRTAVFAAIALTLATYAVVQGFYDQQLTQFVGLLLAAAAAATACEWLAPAGFLLALATIKPQIAGLFILWFAIWAIGDWKRRKPLVWGFAVTMTVLLLGAQILQPDWMLQFATAIRSYQRYAGDEPLLQVLLTPLGGKVAAAVLLVFFIVLCLCWRKTSADAEQFRWAIALASGITLVTLNKVALYNQVLLIPALLVLATRYGEKEKLRPRTRIAMQAAFACLLWQWSAALLVSIWSLAAPVKRIWVIRSPLVLLFALPPIVLLAILLSLRGNGRRPEQSAA